MDIADGGLNHGANLQLWERNNTPAQFFRTEYLNNGYYRIVNINSGKALAAERGGTDSGTNVCQEDISNDASQMWRIVSDGTTGHYIINKASG